MIRITQTFYNRLTVVKLYDHFSLTGELGRVDLVCRRTVWLFWVVPIFVLETVVPKKAEEA